MTFRGIILAITTLTLPMALLAAAGCGHKETPGRAEAAPLAVRMQTLAPTTEKALSEAVGSLQSLKEAWIASKVMGTVTEIHRHAGDLVRQGQTLMTVDSRDLTGQIAQAEGGLAQARAAAVLAETNLQRFEQLHTRGSASQLEMDQARYQYDTARGAVEQAEGATATAKSYQSYATIPAPFSGRVVDQLCEVGDLAAPGRPLMKLEDPSRLRLFASLDAAKAGLATVGTALTVRVPSMGDRLYQGKIAEVVPAADPGTHSVLVKVDLEPDPSLRSGLFARALIPTGERQVLRVPRSAVVQRGGIIGVFVADAGHAAFRMVVVAGDPAEDPEILSGLAAGDEVIVDPPASLEVGAPVGVRS